MSNATKRTTAHDKPRSLAINAIGCRAHGEVWVLMFDDAHRAKALRTIGRWASSPGLSFTWYDAAKLSQRMRETIPPKGTSE